jgi:hypothetical protein
LIIVEAAGNLKHPQVIHKLDFGIMLVAVTGCVIALGIYDLYAVASGGVASSISQFMKTSGADAPFVIFTIGYICGHIFGFMRQKCKNCGGECA